MRRLLTAAAAGLMGVVLMGAAPAAPGQPALVPAVKPTAAPVVSHTPAAPAAHKVAGPATRLVKHDTHRKSTTHAKHAKHAKKVLTKKKNPKAAKPKPGVKKPVKKPTKKA